MWRKHAAARATVFAAAVIVGSCAVWAVLAQVLVTPASGFTP